MSVLIENRGHSGASKEMEIPEMNPGLKDLMFLLDARYPTPKAKI
jgi:hypothetical protein